MKINIDGSAKFVDYWFGGDYIIDEGNDEEYKQKRYEFTIFNPDGGKDSITWEDEIPENSEEIEEQILKQFQEK